MNATPLGVLVFVGPLYFRHDSHPGDGARRRIRRRIAQRVRSGWTCPRMREAAQAFEKRTGTKVENHRAVIKAAKLQTEAK